MQASLVLRALGVRPVSSSAIRAMSTNISGGSMGKAWADKEHAAENQYFNQEDAKKLAELAAKLHKQTMPDDSIITENRTELSAIFTKHGVTASDALLEDVLKFKFNKK